MKTFPILYWPRETKGDNEYHLARRVISAATVVMPQLAGGQMDLARIFAQNPDASVYYPVFCESTGWWGELLGGDAAVTDKVIISPECQLMVIEARAPRARRGATQLLAAEIYPASGFFKKMNSNIATVSDMLATDTGTILALFAGRNPAPFISVLESTGNSYLGCIGRY